MNKAQANSLVLSIDGSAVGCVTDIDINFSQTFLRTRSASSTGWQTQLPDERSFTISGSGLLLFVSRHVWYKKGFQTPVLVDWLYDTGTDGDGYFSGKAWVSTYGESSSGTGFVTYNYELVGDGAPTYVAAVGIGAMVIEGADDRTRFRVR